jgi:uncharacterized protein (DUF488 family)
MGSGRIYTLGHGSQTLASFVQKVAGAGVAFLVDVRSVPYSRYQPDFSREALQRHMASQHVRYVFMGDLLGGRPVDDTCYTDGRVDYTKTRAKDFFKRGIERLTVAYSKGLTLCLVCSEGRASQCHRSKLVGQALADEGIQVLHLLPDGAVQTQGDAIRELTKGQAGLFEEQLLSRKVYR